MVVAFKRGPDEEGIETRDPRRKGSITLTFSSSNADLMKKGLRPSSQALMELAAVLNPGSNADLMKKGLRLPR
jgi:hypothetical protein